MAENETTIISDLPQITLDELTNDTLVPVENVDGTKAANLAQLRKKLNSTYVELVDANLNDLKEDGFYECWGTTLNAPTSDVGAWIVQTATNESVTVQNAFGLGETTFSYMYRRRWNGVSWTAWENKINWLQGRVSTLENEKANVANTVTTNTTQTIAGAKVFTATLLKKSTVIDATTQPEKYTANNAFAFKDKNDITMGFLENAQLPDGTINTAIHARNKDGYQPHISVLVPPSGTTGAYATAPSTPANPDNSVIVTAGYVKNNYVDKTSKQTISGSKRFTQPSEGMSIELVADTNQQTVPATSIVRQIGLYRNSTYTKGDGYTCWLHASRDSNGWTRTELYTRRFLESDSKEILNYLKADITPEGVPISYTKTPPANVTGEEIVTAKWVRDLLKTSGQAYTWSNKQNGYIKFSNGFIIQWGYVGISLVSHSRGTLTFPIPFTSVLSISGNTRRSSGDAVSFAWFSNVTLTTAYWGFDYTGSGGSDGIDWIAVGF